jgi:ketosteroid isomerase-like protein
MAVASSERLVRDFVDALDRHDKAALLGLVREDVEFKSLIQEVEGTFRGRDGVRAYLADLYMSFPDMRVALEAVGGTPLQAVARVRVSATGAGGGVSVDFADWLALASREGKIAWWGFFRSEAEAAAAIAQRA